MRSSRRQFLRSTAALAGIPSLNALAPALAWAAVPKRLVAAPAVKRIVGVDKAETPVWAYDGQVPGPVLRLALGERLQVEFTNRLPQPTTLHWHGMRVPNGMDGVPDLTQAPVKPGEKFDYAFAVRNSGTFWYHPHFATSEQQDRGLHGVIVVPEHNPPPVDRDLVWALDDWRLGPKGLIVDDFGDLHDISHQGRFGNTATINGRVPPDFHVRAGERLRLRLVNVANAWIFALDFQHHQPLVIAYDGHAVPPHAPPGGLVVVGPSQRVDIIVDMIKRPGERFEIVDRYLPRSVYKLTDLVYDDEPLRAAPPDQAPRLDPPDLPEPELAGAKRHELRFSGGAMGGMRSAMYRGKETGIRELAGSGKVWAINGVVASRHDEPPMLNLKLGRSYLLDLVNDTAFPHPVHLHGHPFKVLEVSGNKLARTTWRDTLLLAPRSRATVAMVADNPGKWMLHCHIPEHQEAGMMTVVAVE